ncbi:extracellular solute-binding protein [Fictibacillus nanhaiensis]|uniref:ABC transporter substrate-binding protein n=1 Tax=Fictibacillus nanhaiensis TaxID=742169 RepID=UPI001C97476D|nr:ABC transporter substrate-binding protein [Fictibacillus nanhaiensis]MBY6035059.1 extracellular solute-binding protein [Fictibacillus nanhaiensis]
MKLNYFVKTSIAGLLSISLLAGCGQDNNQENNEGNNQNLSLEQITENAKKEGQVDSLGMPDSWANWIETWKDIKTKYGINHKDTDMSSAEELAKFQSAGEDGPDIGDVGLSFGPLAKEKGLTQPYKTTTWDDIPNWAKDKDGHWAASYQGSISFITDKNRVKNPPKSWADIEKGNYKVAVGDVMKANQAQFAVLAAAMANGGDENDINPGIKYFAKLAKDNRLSVSDVTVANLEKGEVDVAILWDFNSLGYRDQINKERFEVTIPQDASVVSGYTSIINKNAKHPNAAKLTREFILSDEGQANLARGYARPIRENVEIPADAKSKLLPEDMYKNAKPVKDMKKWDETMKSLPQMWQEEVLINVK